MEKFSLVLYDQKSGKDFELVFLIFFVFSNHFKVDEEENYIVSIDLYIELSERFW